MTTTQTNLTVEYSPNTKPMPSAVANQSAGALSPIAKVETDCISPSLTENQLLIDKTTAYQTSARQSVMSDEEQ